MKDNKYYWVHRDSVSSTLPPRIPPYTKKRMSAVQIAFLTVSCILGYILASILLLKIKI